MSHEFSPSMSKSKVKFNLFPFSAKNNNIFYVLHNATLKTTDTNSEKERFNNV